MKNFTCPKCLTNLSMFLRVEPVQTKSPVKHTAPAVATRESTSKNTPNNKEKSGFPINPSSPLNVPYEVNGFRENESIGVNCVSCKGNLILKKGKWGPFIGCDKYIQFGCEGSLTLPCGNCDGTLKVKSNSAGSSMFFGCDQYKETKCSKTLSFEDGFQQWKSQHGLDEPTIPF